MAHCSIHSLKNKPSISYRLTVFDIQSILLTIQVAVISSRFSFQRNFKHLRIATFVLGSLFE